MSKKVSHLVSIGKVGKQLQNFYAKLVDWHVDADNPMDYGLVAPAEAGVGIGISTGRDGEPSRVTIYFEVEDLEKYLKLAESRGGQTILEPIEVPGGPRLAMFTDPEGHIVGLTLAGSMALP